MVKGFKYLLSLSLMVIILGAITFQAQAKEKVKMARGDWDTGWFQAEIYKQLVQQLGYDVEGPTTERSIHFYQDYLPSGRYDFWVNGWFPSAEVQFNKSNRSQLKIIGEQVKGEAIQGYMIDKKTAEKFNIQTLADLKDPTIAKLFDHNGDGKADLLGCTTTAACGKLINHHIKVYGLENTVHHVSEDYYLLIMDMIRHYKNGQSVLFFGWTPHWIVGILKPGIDMVWLPVPYTSIPETIDIKDINTTIPELEGCLKRPCNLGFPIDSIHAVANLEFLNTHLDIKKLLEMVKIPVEDISAQNAKLFIGEDRTEDIERHALHWIQRNHKTVQHWLKLAREANPLRYRQFDDEALKSQQKKRLKVITRVLEPFVFFKEGQYRGFSIELWKMLANELKVEFDFINEVSMAKLVDELKTGRADIGLSYIDINLEREQELDFSYPIADTGLQIMLSTSNSFHIKDLIGVLLTIILAPGLLFAFAIFFVFIVLSSHLIWLLEREHNPQFPRKYLAGVSEGLWWSIVTITTVGYGDRTPRRRIGKLFGIFWMLIGIFIFAYFTANITSSMAVNQIENEIHSIEDLVYKHVVTVSNSRAAEYLKSQGIQFDSVQVIEEAYQLLEQGKVDVVVYSSPILQYHAANEGLGKVKLINEVFHKSKLGFLLQENSAYKQQIDLALLRARENGTYQKIFNRWFVH